MNRLTRLILPLLGCSGVVFALAVKADEARIAAAIASDNRSEAYVARDRYRHPLQTLQLFDLRPDHTVVEIWPGGGWYTEILAPYLKDDGLLITANYDSSDTQASYRPASRKNFEAKMATNPRVYGKVVIASLMFDESKDELAIGAAEPGTVDRVVTFRNAHGWFSSGVASAAFAHFYDILKPGGKLGVVQHRADPGQDWLSKNIGYVSRDALISEAHRAGFTLLAEGFFNSNPLDTKHYDVGVWQLPPSLRDLETDAQKAPYLAIGESDRMTLVFTR